MLRRLLLQSVIGLPLQAALLFWPAGTLAWPAGWAFIGIFAAGGAAIGAWLLRHDPVLLAERMRLPFHAAQRGRDSVVMAAILLLWCLWFPVMGWDARRSFFAAMPAWVQIAGALLLIAGLFGTWLAVAANSFASVTIRVQAERQHRLVDTGAYAWVRHPMYGATLPLLLGIPLLLGSCWGLAFLPCFLVALVLRTRWEEAMLMASLPGYAEYRRRVRYRFIPGLW